MISVTQILSLEDIFRVFVEFKSINDFWSESQQRFIERIAAIFCDGEP